MTRDAMDESNGDAPRARANELVDKPRDANCLGPKGLIDKSEYLRLIQQSLTRLGYGDSAKKLETDSGIEMQPRSATEFQTHILAGEWDAALALLPQLTSDDAIICDAKFLILQQQYLEALEAGEVMKALSCLRKDLAPLNVHQQQLHHLAGLILCPASKLSEHLPTQSYSEYLGGGSGQRAQLMQQLQARLPPALLIPDGRLEQLVEQALLSQVACCPYHNSSGSTISLFSDYQAGVEMLPTLLVQVLDQHSDEVWHISFSHCGTKLATASKDKTVIIWTVGKAIGPLPTQPNSSAPGSASNRPHPSQPVSHPVLRPLHTLLGHDQPVASVCWSPDDSKLLTCSDETLRLYDATTGQMLHVFSQHRESVTSCAWMPDSRRFLSGSVDKSIIMFDVNGEELQKWKRPYRVQDMVVTHNGSCIIIACSDRKVHILRLSDQREVTFQESSPITSITLSSESRFLLVNLQSHTVHLWNLGNIAHPFPQAMEVGPDPMDLVPSSHLVEYLVNEGKQGRYVLRSSFGGTSGSFVVHGSEDCQVYIWHRDSGELLLKLDGHIGTVNSVSWNSANPYLLASAADDGTVRIWVAAVALEGQ